MHLTVTSFDWTTRRETVGVSRVSQSALFSSCNEETDEVGESDGVSERDEIDGETVSGDKLG